MILNVHLPGVRPYEVGDEIWHTPLADAIRAEARAIAESAGASPLGSTSHTDYRGLQDHLVAEMNAALRQVGDTYLSPDGVLYSLAAEPAVDRDRDEDKLGGVGWPAQDPIVEEVLRFEDLPLGSHGTRRAVVRWSDGTESEGLKWYADEVLVSEGDLIGKTREQLRSLHFRRDRDWLQS
jgi:hypothetical protein